MSGKSTEGKKLKNTKHIDIGVEFSPFPGGRVRTDGPYSGEAFREDYLSSNLRSEIYLVIKIDSAEGFGSSFLEECFGGLVRSGFDAKFLKNHIKISYENPAYSFYEQEIWNYINDATINV